MSGINRLISELLRAANTIDRLSAERITVMLDGAIVAICQLRLATNIIPIPNKDALVHIRTVAAGAEHLSSDDWRHALLHAAGMIRDLSVVIDSATVIRIRRSDGEPATPFEVNND